MSKDQIKYVRLNGEAVRLILDGEKTQMRFAMKKQDVLDGTMTAAGLLAGVPEHPEWGGEVIKPPYERGDVLGVQEAWAYIPETAPGSWHYKASATEADLAWFKKEGWKWRSSTHMPKEAVRIFLKVTDVRVERLQEIKIEDVERDGIWLSGTLLPKEDFAERYNRWLSKKKREKYSWNQNPMVWVVTFERCEKQNGDE